MAIKVSGINAIDNNRQLSVTGVNTLGSVQISSGVITATTGVVTYYGDGQYLDNIVSGVGIQSGGVVIGSGFTTLNFIGAGNTFASNGTTVDISIQGGSGGSGVSTAGVTTGYIWSNPNSIDTAQSLENPDHNYAMFGPIAINATVTVGAGNTFVIV